MKISIFTYKQIQYSYVMVDGEPVPYKTHMKMHDDVILDDEMQKELDIQMQAYEDTLTSEEMRVWVGEEHMDSSSSLL